MEEGLKSSFGEDIPEREDSFPDQVPVEEALQSLKLSDAVSPELPESADSPPPPPCDLSMETLAKTAADFTPTPSKPFAHPASQRQPSLAPMTHPNPDAMPFNPHLISPQLAQQQALYHQQLLQVYLRSTYELHIPLL